MTLEVLICSFNKGIVKIGDVLLPQRDDVTYILSYQYTDERYLELIPNDLLRRPDVRLYKYKGQGLSANRNQALTHATADVVLYADDDTRLLPTAFDDILTTFARHEDLDVALFCAETYTGRLMKDYPTAECPITSLPKGYHISTIEMAFRRSSIQGVIRYDERFGLGTRFLTCGEEDIWMIDALRHNLAIRFFPVTTVQTSTLMKQRMIFVDAGVQRSYGAFLYYVNGRKSWFHCLRYAISSTLNGYSHFFPMLRHLMEGARYIRRTK